MDAQEKAELAALISEWLDHRLHAERYGSKDPGAVADVLTYGKRREYGEAELA